MCSFYCFSFIFPYGSVFDVQRVMYFIIKRIQYLTLKDFSWLWWHTPVIQYLETELEDCGSEISLSYKILLQKTKTISYCTLKVHVWKSHLKSCAM